MQEALTIYMRASLLARDTARMETWSEADLVCAFHCRDNPPFETFCKRMGIDLEADAKESEAAALSANAENFVKFAKLLAQHPSTKNIVSIEEVSPKRKAKRA